MYLCVRGLLGIYTRGIKWITKIMNQVGNEHKGGEIILLGPSPALSITAYALLCAQTGSVIDVLCLCFYNLFIPRESDILVL